MGTSVGNLVMHYPAELSRGFGSNDEEQEYALLSLGEDLMVQVIERVADSTCDNKMVRIEVYDGDGNYIATMGFCRNSAQAMRLLPAMIPVIRELHPNHVESPDA